MQITMQKEKLIEMINDLPKEFPEWESDVYEAGYITACEDIIKLINNL